MWASRNRYKSTAAEASEWGKVFGVEPLNEQTLERALQAIRNETDRAQIKLCIKPTGLVLSSACIAHFGSVEAAYAAAKAVMEASGYFWDGTVRARLSEGELRGLYGSHGK